MRDENVDGWKVDCTGGMMTVSGSDDAQLCAAVTAIFDEAAAGETAWDYTFSPSGKAVYEHMIHSVTDKAGLEAAIKFLADSAEAGKLYHVTINLAPGEYVLQKPIELTEETLGFSTVAFRGEGKAVISGAVKIPGNTFKETQLNGAAVYSAPQPPELSTEGGTAYRDVFIGTDIMSATRLTRPVYPYDGSLLVCVPEGPTEYWKARPSSTCRPRSTTSAILPAFRCGCTTTGTTTGCPSKHRLPEERNHFRRRNRLQPLFRSRQRRSEIPFRKRKIRSAPSGTGVYRPQGKPYIYYPARGRGYNLPFRLDRRD